MRDPNRYAVILRLRQRAEDRQALAVAAARNALQQATRQRTSLELARQSALEHAGSSMANPFDADEVRSYYQYERHLASLRDQKDAQIRELQRQESEQLAILEQKTRERRIAEKLHERRRESYRMFLRQAEQKNLDETAVMYAARSPRAPVNEWGDES